MAVESEAAEAVVSTTVKMILGGSEVVLKLTGKGVAFIGGKIWGKLYKALTDPKETQGEISLKKMIKSGEPTKNFTIPSNQLEAFTRDSKLYGLAFSCIWDKHGIDKNVDIIVRDQDSSKVSRILEKLGWNAESIDELMKQSLSIESANNGVPDRLIKFGENKIKLDSIPDIPEMPDKNSKNKDDIARIKRVEKYAKRIQKYGPDSIEKPSIYFLDGKATISDGEEILMAYRAAQYNEVLATIMTADRPDRDRNETEKETAPNMAEKRSTDNKSREETQADPTMAPSQKEDRAFGAESKMSRNGEVGRISFNDRIQNTALFNIESLSGEQPFAPQAYFSTNGMEEKQAMHIESSNLDVKSAMHKTEKNPNPESVYSALKGRCTKKAEHLNEVKKASQVATKAIKVPEAIK